MSLKTGSNIPSETPSNQFVAITTKHLSEVRPLSSYLCCDLGSENVVEIVFDQRALKAFLQHQKQVAEQQASLFEQMKTRLNELAGSELFETEVGKIDKVLQKLSAVNQTTEQESKNSAPENLGLENSDQEGKVLQLIAYVTLEKGYDKLKDYGIESMKNTESDDHISTFEKLPNYLQQHIEEEITLFEKAAYSLREFKEGVTELVGDLIKELDISRAFYYDDPKQNPKKGLDELSELSNKIEQSHKNKIVDALSKVKESIAPSNEKQNQRQS